METVHIPLDVGEGTLLESIDPVVLQVQLSQGVGIFESSGGDVANIVVIEIEVHEPLEVVKHPVVHNPDIIKAEVNGLKSFKAIEAISGEILQQVVTKIKISDGGDLTECPLVNVLNEIILQVKLF